MGNHTITEREIYVDHEKNKRSGHMGHALVDCGNGRILDFNSNVDYNRSDGHSGYGWMEYHISNDYGKTFGDVKILPYSMKMYEEGIHTALCEKAVKAPDGRIVLFFQITDASLEIACEPWSAPTIAISTDNGETFSDGFDIGADAGRIYDAVADDEYVYFLMESNEHFLGTKPEHVYKLYRAGNDLVFHAITLPISALGKGYGALEFAEDGALYAYAYDSNDECNLGYAVSYDKGLTWSEERKSYVSKKIRNPQIQRVGNEWFLLGRNGSRGEGLVLYHGNDGIHWDEGVMVDVRPVPGTGYYSNMLPICEPGQAPIILMQYSHVYKGSHVNIIHRYIKLEA